MFNYKKEAQKLRDELVSTQRKLEDVLCNSDKCHIIKMIPDCDSQFYLDGEFVVDDSRAVYKSYDLNISETVLFKAGMEASRRCFIAQIDAGYAKQSEYADRIVKYKQDIKFMEDQCESLKKKLESMQGKLKKQETEYENKIQQLSDKLISCTNDYMKAENKYEAKLNQLEDSLSEANILANKVRDIDNSSDVVTSFGVVKASK